MPVNTPTRTLQDWPTLNQKDEPYEFGDKELAAAVNVEHTRNNKVRRRLGADHVYDSPVESAWSDGKDTFLYTAGGVLYSFPDHTPLRSGLTPGGRLSAYRVTSRIYWSNGFETGVISGGLDRSLGMNIPAPVTFSLHDGGQLKAGTYQIAQTFVRDDGQESGASGIVYMDVADGQRVLFQTAADPDAYLTRVYMSTVDGTELFMAAEGAPGSEMEFRGPLHYLQKPCRTLFHSPPAPFTDVDFFSSRLLYAVGEFLTYSAPFAYELVDQRKNYIPMNAPVLMVGSTDDGVYVGTSDGVYFLSGLNPETWGLTGVSDSGVIPGTKTYVKHTAFGEGEQSEDVLIFGTKDGIMAGFPGGRVVNLTDRKIIIPDNLTAGSALFREQRGQNHIVITMR